ncbi:MAG: hypothetical protein ACTHQM_14345 [Thermoanaerobaculia bacterium]
MPELATVTLIGVGVAAVLSFVFYKVRQKDLLGALMEKRKPTSRVVSRAEYVEGAEAVPVALSISSDTLFYENTDLEASFELARIDEVEYDDELTTGKSVLDSQRVLRLRSHGRSFEFVLEKAEQAKWASVLPQRTLGAQHAHAV